LLLALLI
jgi:hypothetical protein